MTVVAVESRRPPGKCYPRSRRRFWGDRWFVLVRSACSR